MNDKKATETSSSDYERYKFNAGLEFEVPSNWGEIEVPTENRTVKIVKFKEPNFSSQIRIHVIDCSFEYKAQEINERRNNSLNEQYKAGRGEFWVPDSGKIYLADVCSVGIQFYEYTSLPLPGGDYSENFTVITENFTSGKYSIAITLTLDMNETEKHQEFRDQYWRLIESIECPVIEE